MQLGASTPAPRRLLLVDDDARFVAALADRLRREGFEVAVARSAAETERELERAWPDLVLLDLMLPHTDGETIAARIKRRADIPIVMLTAVTDSEAKVGLIQRFAEDYVTKPFEFPELVARIDRILRRVGNRVPVESLRLGPDLRLVLRRGIAVVSGKPVTLSPIEVRLLTVLAANRPDFVPTAQLLDAVWSTTEDPEPAYVWVSIRRLRQKLEVDPDRPRHLLSDRSFGYRLVGDE